MFTSPVVTKLMSSDEVGLASDHSLAIVVPAGAEAAVQVQGVAVLEILWSTNTSNTVTSGRPNIGQAKDASFKLDVSEQMSKTKVFVSVFSAEHFQKVPDIPARPRQ